MPPLRGIGRSNFDKGLHILTTTLIKKQHIIIRTAMLYVYIYACMHQQCTMYTPAHRRVCWLGHTREIADEIISTYSTQ